MTTKTLCLALAISCAVGIRAGSAQTVPTTVKATPELTTIPAAPAGANCIDFTQEEPKDLLQKNTDLFNGDWTARFSYCVDAETKSFDAVMTGKASEAFKHERLIQEYGTLRVVRKWYQKIIDAFIAHRKAAKPEVTEQQRLAYATTGRIFDNYESD